MTVPAIQKIIEKRKTIFKENGWDSSFEDKHTNGELLSAAEFYYNIFINIKIPDKDCYVELPKPYFNFVTTKNANDQKELLLFAGAFCLAEIDRLKRLKMSYKSVKLFLQHIIEDLQ